MLSFIRKHPVGAGAGAALAIAGLAWLAFGFFGVHTLFIDDVVDESGPVFAAAPAAVPIDAPPASAAEPPVDIGPTDASTDAVGTDSTGATATTDAPQEPDAGTTEPAQPTAPAEIVTEYRGVFEGDAHPTAGNAVVLGNGTGQRFLRLESFETDNGPDLNVYLVNSSTGDVSDYIDLGDLKGNIGDQNYEIPDDLDLDVYDEVVIWCVRFGVGFGDALLMPA